LEIVRALPIPCQVGGGIRTAEAIEGLLGCGVQQVVCGTRACQDLEWLEQMTTRFPQRICVGIDARDGRVATQGWTESSDQDAWELARRVAQFPIAGIVFTDIARDGVLQGPNSLAMETMAHAVTVPVIASGGISSLDDIADLARRGLHGCIVGRALYEGRLTIADANAVAQKNSAIAN
jgi:phosphoribosylformimino-5-aminoimidazole carboxamide ribotide isomerase